MIKKIGGIILLISLFVIYKNFDPYQVSYFPKCPFREITGFLCPGCGAQRTLHYLFNLEFSRAFQENGLLVLSLPYIFLGLYFDSVKNKSENMLLWRNRLFGVKPIYFITFIVITFGIIRNL